MEVLIRKEQHMKTNYRTTMEKQNNHQKKIIIPRGQTLHKFKNSAEFLQKLCIVLAIFLLVSCEKKDLCERVHPHDN